MSPLAVALILVGSSAVGCTIGRFAGKPLKICPYVLSAIISAVLPILVGIAMGAEAAMVGLGCGAGGAVGTYLSGHRSKALAVTGAVVGSGLLSAVVLQLIR
jgi:hypothetical protein